MELKRNVHGVPQYPRGHTGRLLVVLAAVATLERPTAVSVAKLVGLSKGSIDRLVLVDLPSHFGVLISKDGPVYRIESWGQLLRQTGVKQCLTVPVSGTIIKAFGN